MEITSKLIERLPKNGADFLNVSNLLQSIEGLLQRYPNFFPEYTNHGKNHVQAVLNLAGELIPDEICSKLEPRHIGYLICAIAIHDLGMFLSVDGFNRLLESDWKDHCTEDLDKQTWTEAWEAYKAEVRRFSDEKLLRHFGQKIDISAVCTDLADMDLKDYLIIGEFLRRHHPRLAHEIACSGFPGNEIIPLFPTGYDEEERNLIGLLARSHGMNLRDTEDFLAANFSDAHYPCGCPIFYLMAVLRLADLLDAGKHRAPEIREQHQHLLVPASIQEWCWNQQLKPSGFHWKGSHDALSIDANPGTSTEFVLLKKWMNTIQQELDVSGSVISEKYRSDYYLTIHRIKSTILDPKSKKHQGKFLAREAKLQANPELLKLLIEPLYDKDPSCGVRELLQNAVDACVERKQWEEDHGNPNYQGLVEIHIEDKTCKEDGKPVKRTFFTVKDNGMGMNEDILLNYFLSAGSSYRRSDSWAKDFAPDGDTPKVARTGKFGVGVLAAFLLGNRVTVTTRHFRDKQGGYRFSFGLEPVQLDISRESGIPAGTTIEIALKEEALQFFRKNDKKTWCQWFVFDDPAVTYYLDGVQQDSPAGTIPRCPEDSFPWFKLDSMLYENYLWTYAKTEQFYCNGIAIRRGVFQNKITENDMGLALKCPGISVIDPASHLNINLSRSHLLEIPDKTNLIKELFRYQIARLLTAEWRVFSDNGINYSEGYGAPGLGQVPLLQKADGFLPNHPAFVSAANVRRFVTLFSCDENSAYGPPMIPDFLPADMPFMIVSSRSYFHRLLPADKYSMMRYFLFPSIGHVNHLGIDLSYGVSASSIWISADHFTSLIRESNSDLSEVYATRDNCMYQWHITKIPMQSKWMEHVMRCNLWKKPLSYQNLRQLVMDKYGTYQMPIDESKFVPAQWAFAADTIVHENTLPGQRLFQDMLHAYLGSDIWIPHDMEDRRKKFPKAFRELKYYIDRISR